VNPDFSKGWCRLCSERRDSLVLMLAYMDEEAGPRLRSPACLVPFRTRGLWRKGATSGNM